ncbi:(deoxy)nucleoside triphosphate pyrophosphohydrolase [Desulfovibrio inopinatus]|uniref:(deoxy)nucleoside triphosphate pyrophosphohydrolase n=1 Tax=Desulfovibrio inopinatus TaxID=102109 RepID=UPI0004279072|nr:(deoxy)nucleoside triphosphate pyrophosphohydrolase [Desulfovibrio inopinatus]
MSSSSRYIDVVAGVLWRHGEILAVTRPPGKSQAGAWEFPGGKVEPGEALSTALCRELHEELGIAVDTFAFWREITHCYAHVAVRLHFFHVHAFTGEPQALEGQKLCWKRPRQLPLLPFLEADRAVVALLADEFGDIGKDGKRRNRP